MVASTSQPASQTAAASTQKTTTKPVKEVTAETDVKSDKGLFNPILIYSSYLFSLCRFRLCVFALCLTLFISAIMPTPGWLQAVLYSVFIQYYGAHQCLQRLLKKYVLNDKEMPNTEITESMALHYPIFGSTALFSLYICLRWLSDYWTNVLICVYIGLICTTVLRQILIFLGGSLWKSYQAYEFTFAKTKELERSSEIFSFNLVDLICTLMGIAIFGLWVYTEHWALHNVLAIALSLQILSEVNISSFRTGVFLLIGLFFYDIFWVFKTDVMRVVATSVNAPLKLLLPTGFNPLVMHLLGLGDIVIPGFFVSICLLIDAKLHSKKEQTQLAAETNVAMPSSTSNFSKFYFWVVLIAYESGLVTTYAIMKFFKHPQPALLYLVPFCLLSVLGAAILNGQIKEVIGFIVDETLFWPTNHTAPQPEGSDAQEKLKSN